MVHGNTGGRNTVDEEDFGASQRAKFIGACTAILLLVRWYETIWKGKCRNRIEKLTNGTGDITGSGEYIRRVRECGYFLVGQSRNLSC